MEKEKKPQPPERRVLPRNRIGGPGGIRNRGMSEFSDTTRNTDRPTEDDALQSLEEWFPQIQSKNQR